MSIKKFRIPTEKKLNYKKLKSKIYTKTVKNKYSKTFWMFLYADCITIKILNEKKNVITTFITTYIIYY